MKRSTGFTLIEVMIVLVIILLLAAVTYPSYASFVVKTRRVEGQVALLELMQKQESYYTRHHTYIEFSSDSSDADADADQFKWWSGSRAPGSAYELRGRACPGQTIARCIELEATPGTELVDANFRDKHCQVLTLASTGKTGASGPYQRCWP
jgi:type IV pilus assembly protein PilE